MITHGFKQHQEKLILLGLSLLIILLRLPSVVQPFNNDGAANAYHARLMAQGEPLYSTHHPAHHLPGVYYSYLLTFWLFGDDMSSVKWGLIIVYVATIILFYYFAKFLHSGRLALIAALFYAILTSDTYLFGPTAQTEHFANFFRIATVFLWLWLRQRATSLWQYSLIGMLAMLCFWFKAIYIAVLGVVVLGELTTTPYKLAFQRCFAAGLGALAAFIPVVAYFTWLGLLPQLLQVFAFGQSYVNTSMCNNTFGYLELYPYVWLLYPLLGLAQSNVAILILGLYGWGRLIWLPGQWVLWRYIAFWFAFSYLEAIATRSYHPYYYLLVVPALTLLASWFLLDFITIIGRFGSKQLTQRLLGVLTILIIAITVRHNLNYYVYFTAYALGQESFETFIRDGFAQPDHFLLEVAEVADYIKTHTTVQDTLYYWSDNVQLYYLAERRAPVQVIWVCYLGSISPAEQVFNPQTKYIVIDPHDYRPLPEWFKQHLNQLYQLETTLHEQQIYRRIAP